MNSKDSKVGFNAPLWQNGFRPFFALAILFAIFAVTLWLVEIQQGAVLIQSMPVIKWHAHEMIFGYASAVIAGFLLTAVPNWTGTPGLTGKPLAVLAATWLCARIALVFCETNSLAVAAVFELLFYLGLCIAICKPILAAKQLKQVGIIAKVILLMASSSLYYYGTINHNLTLANAGLYSGFYMVVALTLVMLRRLLPFFVKSALQEELPTSTTIDGISLAGFLVFWLAQVFSLAPVISTIVCFILFVVHLYRCITWIVQGVTTTPLLWVLYAAYGFLIAGFGFNAFQSSLAISPFVAIHAFAFGSIGIMTVGIMTRVAWGHTGRNLQKPPKLLNTIFWLIIGSGVTRTVLVQLAPSYHLSLIVLSGILWLAAFTFFMVIYVPLLFSERADTKAFN